MAPATSALTLTLMLALTTANTSASEPPANPASDKPKPATIDLRKAAAKPRTGPAASPATAPAPARVPAAQTVAPAPAIALPDTAPSSAPIEAPPLRQPPVPIIAAPATSAASEWVGIPAPQGVPSRDGQAVVLAPGAHRVLLPAPAPIASAPASDTITPSLTLNARPLFSRVIRVWGEAGGAQFLTGQAWSAFTPDQSLNQVLSIQTTEGSGVELELDNRVRLTIDGPSRASTQRMQIEGLDAGPGRIVIQLDEGHLIMTPGLPGPDGRRAPIAVRCGGQILLLQEATEVWRDRDGSVRTRGPNP